MNDIDALAAELSEFDIYHLRHTRSHAQRFAADFVATAKPCRDFDSFRHLFATPSATALIRGGDRTILAGDMFILAGLMVYVAQAGARLRLIMSNGTENNILPDSLNRAFYRDPAARRVLGA